jgi:hypothetical protein
MILKVLQLFVVTTSDDPINRFTNPNTRRNHSNMWQYFMTENIFYDEPFLLENT